MAITFRHGQRKLQRFAYESGDTVTAGDLMWATVATNGGITKVRPASEFTWNTNLATTQADFANVFAGVAYTGTQKSGTSITNAVTEVVLDVSPVAVYNASITSGSYKPGTYVGPGDSGSDTLLNQTLAPVAAAAKASAIGRVDEATTSSATANVTFAPAHVNDSANANAALS